MNSPTFFRVFPVAVASSALFFSAYSKNKPCANRAPHLSLNEKGRLGEKKGVGEEKGSRSGDNILKKQTTLSTIPESPFMLDAVNEVPAGFQYHSQAVSARASSFSNRGIRDTQT